MIVRPMNPHTTDGIAARSSTRTFKNSRVFPVANSAMKMAPPREKGMATISEDGSTPTETAADLFKKLDTDGSGTLTVAEGKEDQLKKWAEALEDLRASTDLSIQVRTPSIEMHPCTTGFS